MNGKTYVKDHGVLLIILGIAAGIIQSVLFMFHVGTAVQIFVFTVQFLGILAAMGYDYSRKKEFYQQMEQRLEALEEKYLLLEMLKRPEFLEGQILYDNLVLMGKSMNDEIFRQVRKNNAFKRYIETWVHEVKLPIASIRLMLHDYRGESARTLKEQVGRIESYVEQVLYYLRSEVPEKDYMISGYSLKAVTDRVIAENKDSFISNHLRIRQETEDVFVLTDEKWLHFMTGQILSNSVKYMDKETKVIWLWSGKKGAQTVLHIRDNGAGIPREDLPRVFEKSFTGKNGRKGQASTGMGLYLCRELAKMLGHRLEIQSQPGEYTEVTITFYQDEYVREAVSE